MLNRALDAVFAPRRVALVGASDRAGSVGNLLWDNLSGFPGEVVPVCPNRTVGGRAAYQDLRSVPGEIDLVVVATPADSVPGVIEAAADKGVPAAVVLSAGFAEIGGDGVRLQEKVRAAARAGGVRVVGPNCFGVQNADLPLNASIAAGTPPGGGGVSLVTQSGSYGMAVHMLATDEAMRFAKVYAAGNKADLTDAEVLAYLREDPATTVIALLLESITDPRAFFAEARRATAEKPVIAVVGGRTGAGRRAAVSHTAALAADDDILDAALRDSGVVRVRTGLEMLDVARALAEQPTPRGRRVGIITNSGGTGVELADLLADEGLDVPELSPALRSRLSELLPPYGSPRNPVDITPAWRLFATGYPGAIDLLARSGEVDVVVPVLLQRSASLEVASAVRDAVKRLRADNVPVPVYACFVAPRSADDVADVLHQSGVPCLPWPDRTARAIGAAVRYGMFEPKPSSPHEPSDLLGPVDDPGDPIVARDLLEYAGIPVVPTVRCESADEVVAAAARLPGPVVLKVAHPDLTHKSDVGGVRVGLVGEQRIRAAAGELLALAEGASVLVQSKMDGVETVVGGFRDPSFGPVVMVGMGGVLVEVLRDVRFALAPLDHAQARAMLEELRGAAVLSGVRGALPVDRDALADVVVSVGDLLAGSDRIAELDLNPVLAGPDGCVCVDWRILTRGADTTEKYGPAMPKN
ncbi:acetate--CoA ligase family protein [Amycolatopsis echigonensis]|uniref:acetate--CoA ligase family protein n=1 Tax=Amycolatopsis echigonensis TaxID=2576905 RepID=UPI001C825C08|nr:acetate--CoA ligase family protein [Amycolatopsis echigonensis]